MLGDHEALVNDMVRDHVDRIAADQLSRAIALAVAQYSKDRPRKVIEDIAFAGGSISAPDGEIVSIELPIGHRPPSFLPASAWEIYDTPAGALLFVPAAGDATARITFRRAHLLDSETDTVPATDREAVASYAAAILFDQVAAATSGDGNPSIAADTVNHAAKPENYAKRAERLRARYYDLIGLDPKRGKAASVTVTRPVGDSGGGPRLQHGRRRIQ